MLELAGPELRAEALPYWEAAANGHLLIQRCLGCGSLFHYPRPFCPFCMRREPEWVRCCGLGRIYSFTLLRRAGAVVFAPAWVTLDEGPTIMSAITPEGWSNLRIGLRAAVTFRISSSGQAVPLFQVLGDQPG